MTTKAIYVPEEISRSYTSYGRYDPLFKLMKGFEITDDPEKAALADIIITFKTPQKNIDKKAALFLARLSSDKLLICYNTDLHENPNVNDQPQDTPYRMAKMVLFKRADKILCPYLSAFETMWPEFTEKVVYFPHFFVSEYFLHLPLDNIRAFEVVISGQLGEYYPLRTTIVKSRSSVIRRIANPAWDNTDEQSIISGRKIRQDYAAELSKSFAGLATCSTLGYTVAKYFEIPAAGCLLVANNTPELNDLGFVDGKNFIEINEDNAIEKIEAIIAKPDKYNAIRLCGAEMVRARFSEKNAYERLMCILERQNYE